MEKQSGFSTRCVHAGMAADQYGAVVTPIYQTATYHFPSTDAVADVFEHRVFGYAYSRSKNPTVCTVERKLADLEHGTDAVAFGSGMGAISGVLYTVLKAGDHVVCPLSFYSATYSIVHEILPSFGVTFTAADFADPAAVEAAIRPETKVIYIETPANPSMIVTDIEVITSIAKKHGVMTIADNTFCSPYVSTPLDLGVDIVVESCTKYINGHGDALAGIAVCRDAELANDIRMKGLFKFGAVMSAHTASLVERGLKTLELRVERQCSNALAIATWLKQQDWVEIVRYPYLPTDPNYAVATKQMRAGGGVLTFDVKGGVEGGKQLLNHLKLIEIAVSLGECGTLIEHPASMTHASVPREDRLAGGITDGLIRLAVGIETVDDLIEDLEQASQYIKY